VPGMRPTLSKKVREHMISIKTNIAPVVLHLQTKLASLADKDKMIRACAVGILPVIKTRIHEQGKAADGNQIGTYSPGYMKVRTGNFGNSARYSRGKNKGKNKNSGKFTRGSRTGATRPRYNRSSDPKVVSSLTRQMENDFVVIPTEAGYGLGYNNPDNRKKADYVEETYSKQIFSTTKEENDQIIQIATDFIAEI
jgi:hypothetical protein